jgi:hypothetical protein
MVLSLGLRMESWWGGIMLYMMFAAWAVLTVGVLVLMEGLSAFLHTLRLHWSEINSPFRPNFLSFNSIKPSYFLTLNVFFFCFVGWSSRASSTAGMDMLSCLSRLKSSWSKEERLKTKTLACWCCIKKDNSVSATAVNGTTA